MEVQHTLLELEPIPQQSEECPPEANRSSKPVFGRKLDKRRSQQAKTEGGNPKLNRIVRNQLMMKPVDLEYLLEPAHPARAIWALMGQVDLSAFHSAIRSQVGGKGRPANDPRMMTSVWLYAFSQGIGSAREIEQLMNYEPGLMWL
jgi:hypothetical protein